MKHLILKILYNNIGNFISGQSIAKDLQISRTAVKKHIDSLNNIGYNIISQKNRGYMLINDDKNFDKYKIKMYLDNNFADMEVFFYEQINSTNIKAKEHILNCNQGVVIAEKQQSGKGRRGREFISEKGGIYLSYFCKPENITPFDAVKTVITSAVAVCKTIKSLGVDCKIKWANDIFYKDKKLCGILCEMVSESEKVNYLIQGIGINVNNDIPTNLQDIAISLKEITNKEYDKAKICAMIVKELKICNQMLFEDKFNKLLDYYKENCLTLNKKVTVYGKTEYSAIAKDIDNNGFLLIETKEGIKPVLFGDVSVKTK